MDRVIAFHRWLEGTGQDVIVIASFAESTWWNYELCFPVGGFWKEVFNSDVYDHWVNPWVAGQWHRCFVKRGADARLRCVGLGGNSCQRPRSVRQGIDATVASRH
jgi:hypothetical protein